MFMCEIHVIILVILTDVLQSHSKSYTDSTEVNVGESVEEISE